MFYILAILALGVLIIVHEGGHYLVARWSGMRVEKFSLGFGPALLKWRWKGTQFQLAPIFVGGFVQIVGMNPHEEYDEKDPSVYPNRPVLLRFLTIFAGPFTNILFSAVLMFIVFVGPGAETYTGRNVVKTVIKNTPAENVLQPGDVIISVGDKPVTYPAHDFQAEVQRSQSKPIAVLVQREGIVALAMLIPQLEGDHYIVGVQLAGERIERIPLSFGAAAVESLKYPVDKSKLILGGLWDIVTRKAPVDAVGIVGMTGMVRDEMRAGWAHTFEFLALLNVYLGLFNLLPLPALDGGRLVFLGYEIVTRRRPNPKVEAAVHMAGMLVLAVLIILVNFNDVRRRLFG